MGIVLGYREIYFWVLKVDTVSYLVYYETLLQTAIDIFVKINTYFITKPDRYLLENASGYLLLNATVLLQNAAGFSKCDVHYNMHWYIPDVEKVEKVIGPVIFFQNSFYILFDYVIR